MKYTLLVAVLLGVAAGPAACGPDRQGPRTDPRADAALAEAEAARQRAIAARAETEAARAQLARLRAETESAQLQRGLAREQADADAHANRLRVEEESSFREELGWTALRLVEAHGTQILTRAYPLAFGRLSFTGATLLGVADDERGYRSTVRLDYRNLLRQPQYLEIAIEHDTHGGYRSWRFVGHSDIIAPEELTLRALTELARAIR